MITSITETYHCQFTIIK